MSHPPKDGETFDTTCTNANSLDAICEGGGLSTTAVNTDGFFKEHHRYVWYVRTAAADPPAGEPETGA